jgi:DNA processing protein
VRLRTPFLLTVHKHDDLRDWLILIRAPNLGGRRLIDLVESLGSPAAVRDAAARQPGRLGLDGATIDALCRPPQELVEDDLSWLSGGQRYLLTWADERYPALLRRISSPPAALFIEGDPGALWLPQLAIIGSRNPTAGGIDHARAFSAEMCRHGLAVCSGLASGIDAAAHAAALKAGGRTVAVTGTGLDRVYPASSVRLAAQIPRAGALVSEFPPGTQARRSHFPSRNRIIAGLSLGVLVVEAGLNSGSLITARQAAEQGKEVFALPGSLHNPMVKGCHRLIKQGARLVESSADILEALAPLAGELAGALRQALEAEDEPPKLAEAGEDMLDDPDYARLWAVLSYDPQPVDALVRESGLAVREVSSMLLMLELKGKVRAEAGASYCRK